MIASPFFTSSELCDIAGTNYIINANGVYVHTGTSHFSRRATRREEERRKSGNDRRNQRPKLFGSQQSFDFFHRLKGFEVNSLQILRSDHAINTATTEKDRKIDLSRSYGGEFTRPIYRISVRFEK